MTKKFVNKNSLIEALYVVPNISGATLQGFVGDCSLLFSAEAVHVKRCNCKEVIVNYGDVLVKDAKSNVYPLPLDVFEQQFICVEEELEPEDIRIARWLGHNPNSVLFQLGGAVGITTVLPNRTLVLSNGKVVPAGYYIMHNVTRDTWTIMDCKTLSMLSGGKM